MQSENVKTKIKELLIELINEEDWAGARNMLDSVMNLATPSQTLNTPPVVEQSQQQTVPPAQAAPQGTSFDDERQTKLNKMSG